MKKIVLIITILFVSVLTTACINNLAVQELNNKAKEYLTNGDSETAICRLKSSLDLDSNMFETHYNLAVAYIASKKYIEAQKSLDEVLKLNPSFVDAYYSLGVVKEEQAYNIVNNVDENTQDTVVCQPKENDNQLEPEKKLLTTEDKKLICDKLNEAIQYYNEYLTKKVDAPDKDKVNERINFLNTEIKKYNLEDTTSSLEE